MTHQQRRRTGRPPALLIWTAAATFAAAGMTAFTRTVGRAARGLPEAVGAGPDEIAMVADGTPRFRAGAFANPEPSHVLSLRQGLAMLPELVRRGDRGRPSRPVPLVTAPPSATAADLAVTWLGHATTLIEIDGRYVLTDPVWSERVSPSPTVGPARLHPVPITVEQLPALSAVLISHDHYDHLDLPTIRALVDGQRAPFVVPLGVGAHLRRWGVPQSRIVELDWDAGRTIDGIEIVCTPSRHFSGRGLRRNTTLWSSWTMVGPRHRVFFGGDTGYTAAFTRVAQRFGPFDITILPIGAYNDRWPDIHLTPEEAATVHRELGGGLLVPVHWATFDLALHPWAEPIRRLRDAGPDLSIATPRPGERVDPARGTAADGWWEFPEGGGTPPIR